MPLIKTVENPLFQEIETETCSTAQRKEKESVCKKRETRCLEGDQEPNTVLLISSNEGRECGSSAKQADARLKYDCGHSDSMCGRSPSSTIP